MADEYHERELREQELQRRIDEYEHVSQPLNNINELKRALMEASSQENIINIIHQIDSESPKIPIDTSDLCTIWCRYVKLKCDEWSIHFRDFRQPLWQMQQFHLWGHICAAEVTPNTLDSIRTPWVEIG